MSGSKPFEWTHSYLLQVLSTGRDPVIIDPLLLNAFRAVDRADFVPEDVREFAHQDKLVDIGYEEVMTNPVLVAKQLQIFNPVLGGKYLHLGSGTGFVSAILGFVAGDQGKVYTLERVQWLWEQTRANLRKYPEIICVEALYRNGNQGLADKAHYDGIIFSYVPPDITNELKLQLKVGGKLVAPREDHSLLILDKVDEDEFAEEKIYGFSSYSYGEGKEGVA